MTRKRKNPSDINVDDDDEEDAGIDDENSNQGPTQEMLDILN